LSRKEKGGGIIFGKEGGGGEEREKKSSKNVISRRKKTRPSPGGEPKRERNFGSPKRKRGKGSFITTWEGKKGKKTLSQKRSASASPCRGGKKGKEGPGKKKKRTTRVSQKKKSIQTAFF